MLKEKLMDDLKESMKNKDVIRKNTIQMVRAAILQIEKDKGIDSEVAQKGKNFSGGQKQRLTIARALVKKPKILILDDSSSALDYATDAKLRSDIKTLKDITLFVVSQRTASIMDADQIVVLDDGKVVGFGTHDELLKDCSVYQEIYQSQFKKGGQSNGK